MHGSTRSAHTDELTSLRERADKDRGDSEATILELEHKVELARQNENDARRELEQIGSSRDELASRTENLVQEAEDLRQEAAARDKTLCDEIGAVPSSLRVSVRPSV